MGEPVETDEHGNKYLPIPGCDLCDSRELRYVAERLLDAPLDRGLRAIRCTKCLTYTAITYVPGQDLGDVVRSIRACRVKT